jgi:hypothetical protein
MVEKAEQLFSLLRVLLAVPQQNAGLAVPTVPASNIRNKELPHPIVRPPKYRGPSLL